MNSEWKWSNDDRLMLNFFSQYISRKDEEKSVNASPTANTIVKKKLDIKWFKGDDIWKFVSHYRCTIGYRKDGKYVTEQHIHGETYERLIEYMSIKGKVSLTLFILKWGSTDSAKFIVFKSSHSNVLEQIKIDFKNNIPLDQLLEKYETETEIP